MSKQTAIERAQAKLETLRNLEPDQRAELLKLAGIGTASQASAIRRAFVVFQQALDACDVVMVGSGKAMKKRERPNWSVRLSAARSLWEVLGAIAQKKGASVAPGRVQVNVTVPGYASGEEMRQPGVHPVVVEMEEIKVSSAPSAYSAAYAARIAGDDRSASGSADGQPQ